MEAKSSGSNESVMTYVFQEVPTELGGRRCMLGGAVSQRAEIDTPKETG